MPQPTMPAAVRMEQYCPFSQRWLRPMAVPPSNVRVRCVVRGRVSDIRGAPADTMREGVRCQFTRRGGGRRMAARHEGFLRDIVAHPEDSAPRLIYADWLEENGDAARAELIRVQCELAR